MKRIYNLITDYIKKNFRGKSRGLQWSAIKRVSPYIWPKNRRDLRILVVISLIMLVLSKVVSVLTPFTFKWALDALTNNYIQDTSDISIMPIMLIVAYAFGRILSVLFAQMRDAFFATVSQHAVRNLAVQMFEHLHCLSLRFHLNRHTGGINRVIERGVKGIELLTRHTILGMIPTIIELFFIFGILWFYFGMQYMLIIATTMGIYLWFTFVVSEKRMAIRQIMNDFDTEANAKSVDSLLNFETVKYFGNETWESKRFDQSMKHYEGASIQTYTSLSMLNFGQTVIFDIGAMICRILAVISIMEGNLTIGDFVMINALLFQIQVPLNFAGMLYRETKQGLIDIDNMFDLLDQYPEIVDAPNAPTIKVTRGEVHFDNVSFGYTPDRTIFKNISFRVPAGKMVAIVGQSGAGKSTIVRLLCRFYDVSGGGILIDGQNIASVTQASLRSVIGVVPQDTVLFNDTIHYNILYGRPKASDEEVQNAAHLAQIDEFIKRCPEGYQTNVGERGLKLSGGEKQRIAIARTILKHPQIFILDEATSALDTQTERNIQSALLRLSRGHTTLVIAHRLSTIVDADEILVFNDGEIIERGCHEDLLALNAIYAEMWKKQLESEEIFS